VKRTLALLLALVLTFAATAAAELSQKGDLFVHFGGAISPKALPRDSLAPITVRIEGRIKTTSAQAPPALRKIEVALNRGGQIDARGLPLCRQSQIELATSAQALSACGPALIGSGGIVAIADAGGRPDVLIRGEVLLFNAREGGRQAILAHIFQTQPAASTRLVVFHIRHTGGRFGTLISASLPPSLNRHGYLTQIFLTLQRKFTVHGRAHSYISASCAAPPGFTAASFPFAKVSMSFSDGRTLSSTMERTCRVRG